MGIIYGPIVTTTLVEEKDLVIDDLKLEIHGFKEQFHKNILDEILEPIKKAERIGRREPKAIRDEGIWLPEMPLQELAIQRTFSGGVFIPGMTTIRKVEEEARRGPLITTGPGRLTILTDISGSMAQPDLNVFEGSRWESAWMLTLGLIECAAARKDILSVILYDKNSHTIVKESMDYEKAFNKIYPMKQVPNNGTSISQAASIAANIAENGKTSTIIITDVEQVSQVIDGAEYINRCKMHGPVILLWITHSYGQKAKETLLQSIPGLIIIPDYPTQWEAFVTRNLKTIMNALPRRRHV